MWVIIAKKSRSEVRDNILSEILEVNKDSDPDIFVRKRGYKYQVCSSLRDALIYKQTSSCEKLIKRFYSGDNNTYKSVFVWIKDYFLTYRKITKSEWDKMCDDELHILNLEFTILKDRLEKKKLLIK